MPGRHPELAGVSPSQAPDPSRAQRWNKVSDEPGCLLRAVSLHLKPPAEKGVRHGKTLRGRISESRERILIMRQGRLGPDLARPGHSLGRLALSHVRRPRHRAVHQQVRVQSALLSRVVKTRLSPLPGCCQASWKASAATLRKEPLTGPRSAPASECSPTTGTNTTRQSAVGSAARHPETGKTDPVLNQKRRGQGGG